MQRLVASRGVSMPILTILGLAFSAIKIIVELVNWLERHPDITATVRSKVSDMRVQVEDLETTVGDLQEYHSRVEAP
jgi:hypothetical protein